MSDWWWERLKAGGEGYNRGWDGWMASPTQWAQVLVNSASWCSTGRPGVLQSVGSWRVGHEWATELNWNHSSRFFQVCSPERSAWGSWDHKGKRCSSSQGAQECGTDSPSWAARTLSSDESLTSSWSQGEGCWSACRLVWATAGRCLSSLTTGEAQGTHALGPHWAPAPHPWGESFQAVVKVIFGGNQQKGSESSRDLPSPRTWHRQVHWGHPGGGEPISDGGTWWKGHRTRGGRGWWAASPELRWSQWGPRFLLLLSRSHQTEATSHGEPWGNSGKRIPAFQQPSDCSHSPLWALRKLRKEKSGCWPQVVRCVSKGMISVRWLVHLPTHRKVLNSLTLDASPWFCNPKRLYWIKQLSTPMLKYYYVYTYEV